jgi:hypothetical protein
VSSAAINMGVQASQLYVDLDSFGYVPKSGRARSYGSSVLENPVLISIVAAFPPIVYKDPFSPTSSPASVVCFLYDSHSDLGKMESP